MARHSIEDFREVIESLEGRAKNKFLKAHADYWEIEPTDREFKALLKSDDGEEIANYVLSFTANGKTALMDWLKDAAEQGLIDDPFAEPEDDEEEEEDNDDEEDDNEEDEEEEEEDNEPRSRRGRVAKQTSKKTAKRSRDDDDDEPRGRGRPGLSEAKINEIRRYLKKTKNLSETAEQAEVSIATILKYFDQDEREELGLTVKRRREDEPRSRKTSREVSKGRGRSSKENSRRSSKEVSRGRGRPARTSRER